MRTLRAWAAPLFPKLLFANGEFWNTVPDSEWTADQVAQLLTASPWSVKTRVKMSGSYTDAPPLDIDRRQTGIPGTPTNGSSSGPSPSGTSGTARPPGSFPRLPRINTDPIEDTTPSKKTSNAPVAFYGDVTVTWESAAPIRLARREPLGQEFEHHYAVRVTGLPPQTFMSDAGSAPAVFRLLVGTSIERGGKRERPDYVLRLPEKKSLIFAFPAPEFTLRRRDRYVSFVLNVNEMAIKVRFDLRLMVFRDLLAV